MATAHPAPPAHTPCATRKAFTIKMSSWTDDLAVSAACLIKAFAINTTAENFQLLQSPTLQAIISKNDSSGSSFEYYNLNNDYLPVDHWRWLHGIKVSTCTVHTVHKYFCYFRSVHLKWVEIKALTFIFMCNCVYIHIMSVQSYLQLFKAWYNKVSQDCDRQDESKQPQHIEPKGPKPFKEGIWVLQPSQKVYCFTLKGHKPKRLGTAAIQYITLLLLLYDQMHPFNHIQTNLDVTWQRLPPAAAWQTVEECVGRAHSPPSAPGPAGGCHPWWGNGTSVTWRLQTL